MLKIFFALMRVDLKLLLSQLKDKAIDSLIWCIVTLGVAAYIMPALGLKNFGLFQAGSIFISVIWFELYNQLFLLATQIEQRKHLFYLFTLPVPVWLIFFQKVIFFTINGLMLSLLMVPLSKMILWQQMDFSSIAWGHLFLVQLTSSFFFACFLLLILGFVEKTQDVGHLLMRLMFPLWFLGGFQFSWTTLYNLNHYIAYFGLLSPYTYANEAARSAILGPSGFLPFWMCIFILLSASFLFGFFGYRKVKRKLDLV